MKPLRILTILLAFSAPLVLVSACGDDKQDEETNKPETNKEKVEKGKAKYGGK